MSRTNKIKGTAVSIPLGVAIGGSVSVFLTCLLAGVLAWLVLEGNVAVELSGYISMGILIASAITGSLVAAARVKRRWMFVCCVTGVVYLLALLGITAVFFGGNYQGIGVTTLVIIIGSVFAGMLGVIRNGRREKSYRGYRSC